MKPGLLLRGQVSIPGGDRYVYVRCAGILTTREWRSPILEGCHWPGLGLDSPGLGLKIESNPVTAQLLDCK